MLFYLQCNSITPAVILVPVFIFLRYIQNNSHKLRISILQPLKNLGLIFGITIPMVSWWYYERFATGNPTGHIFLEERLTDTQYILGFLLNPWDLFAEHFFRTFWGFYGLSFFVPPDFYFQIIMIMVGISAVGLGYGIALKIKQHGLKIFRNWKYQSIFALALSPLFITLAQSLFSVQLFISTGTMFLIGWFTFISFTAIAMILLLGFRTIIINTKLKRFKEESLLVAFVILIIFNLTTFFWLVPKYYVSV